MKKIKLSYFALLSVLILLWLLADKVFTARYGFQDFKLSIIYFTGTLAIGCMSVGMFLSIRPMSVEPFLGGLDKSYRLHKWLGVSALVFSVLHWQCIKAPKWLAEMGWLQKPVHKPAVPTSGTLPGLFNLLHSQHRLADTVGNWAFYASVALIAVALFKRFPYRHFFKTHRLMAVAYLALVFHSVVLMNPAYWHSPLGPAIGLLFFVATLAAAISLLRRVGRTRRAVGAIVDLTHYRDNRVLGVTIKLKDRWFGHAAGQFAFVTFDPAEGPHPFTISSAWHDDGKLSFHIKGIGDYTKNLSETRKVGDLVTVEGPYGRFDFGGNKPRQIWIAGGIGITPFLARMQARELPTDKRIVDLFYSTNAPDEDFIGKVKHMATIANVRLHVMVSGKDPRLTPQRLRETVPEWMSADVWFCGPDGFGRALKEDLVANGLRDGDFHQELFDMR